MNITDSHCHLDEKSFDTDREAIIERALATGVIRLITVGTNIKSCKKTLALVEKYPQIYASVGIHPNDTGHISRGDVTRLEELAQHPKVVAIGETGLDFYRHTAPKEGQIKMFQYHLDIAGKLKLPVVIHYRQSTTETIQLLGAWLKGGKTLASPGVIHCFSGDWPVANLLLDMGFYLSFAGYVGYPKSLSHAVIRQMPLNKLLVETDAPFLPPQPFRGQRNEPSYVTHTIRAIAEFLGMDPEAVAEITTGNAQALFKF